MQAFASNRKAAVNIERPSRSPFHPDNTEAYLRFRDAKLAGYPSCADDLSIELRDPFRITESERGFIRKSIAKTGMLLYSLPAPLSKSDLARFGALFGLTRLDRNPLSDDEGISSIEDRSGNHRGEYIPYTNRAIQWHTDGYYNTAQNQVRSIHLHCASPSAEGGENELFDPEILYILIREKSPDLIRALFLPDAMTIPANVDPAGGIERDAITGPVFSVNTDGTLHMRYTARTRSIVWKSDPDVIEAARIIGEILSKINEYMFKIKMKSGQGFIGRNILHTRSAFIDSESQKRLIYRARYYDLIEI